MLHAIAELSEDNIRSIERILRHEIDADSFRANQSDDLFDLLQQYGGHIIEHQMRLIEKDQVSAWQVADFGKRSNNSDKSHRRKVA